MSDSDDRSWIVKQHELIQSLTGVRIEGVHWTEEALAWSEDKQTPVLFRHPNFPFIQSCDLRIKLSNGRVGHFDTYQDDDVFGLSFHYDDRPLEQELPTSARKVTDQTFPLGLINCVEIEISKRGNIDELLLGIGERQILLKAGEVYEHDNRTFSVADEDAMVLVFPLPEDIAKVQFHQLTEPMEI